MKGLTYADQISGFTALPGINNKMSQGLLDGIYWVPQMVCIFWDQLFPITDFFSNLWDMFRNKDTIKVPSSCFTSRIFVIGNKSWPYRSEDPVQADTHHFGTQLTWYARFHHIWGALHAWNSTEMVPAGMGSPWMAYRVLERTHYFRIAFDNANESQDRFWKQKALHLHPPEPVLRLNVPLQQAILTLSS